MSTLRLDEFVTVTVGADGTGTSLPKGPSKYGETWRVTLMSMQTTGNETKTGELFAYRGPAVRINQIDYTSKIDGDTSNTNVELQVGEYLTFKWVGCTPGAIGTVHITGDLIARGR